MAKNSNPFMSVSAGDQYDDGPEVDAGDNPFLQAIQAQRKRRDEEEQAKYNADQLKKQQDEEKAKKDEEAKKQADAKKSLLDRAGDVASGVGNFVKDAAVDVYDTGKNAVTGIKDVVEGSVATNNQAKLDEQRNKIQNDANKQIIDIYGKYQDKGITTADGGADESRMSKEDLDKIKQLRGQKDSQLSEFDKKNNYAEQTKENKKQYDESQKVDAAKTAFAAGETVLNIGTLGVGTGLKTLAKQGIKQGVKTLIKEGGEQAAKDALEEGGEQFVKKGAQEAIEAAATKTAKSGAKKLAGNVAKDATIGTAYGVTQTGKRADENTTAEDYLINMAFGAGVGGAIPVLGAGLKKGAQKLVTSFKNRQSGIVTKETENLVNKGKDEASQDVNNIMNQAIEEQSDKYGTTAFTRAKNWIGDQIDPYRALAKVDDRFAKANGIKRTALNAEDSLEDLARRSHASEREAAGLFEQKHDVVNPTTGKTEQVSAKDLVMKYKGDSEAGKEFNNYTNAKFDQEFRQKTGGKRIMQNLDDNQVDDFIKQYEAKNPDAVADAAVKKKVNDQAVDYMVKSKVLTEAEGETIKNSYQHAVPLERVFPEDLARPEISGKNIGSISKQTVIQRLEGGSEIPVSNSFDAMLNRVYKAVSQGNRAKLAQKLLERQEDGLLPGSKVLVTAGNKEARATIREQASVVTKGINYLEKKVQLNNKQMRSLSTEINNLEKEGLSISLSQGGKNTMPEFNPELLRRLKDQKGKTVTSRQFFKSLVEADPADLDAVKRKIATRQPKLAAKLDEVANLRTKIDSLKDARTNMRDMTAEFKDDPTTGKQVVSGIIDGQSYKIEVPPDIAKSLQGLDQQKLTGVLKGFALLKKPFEVAWTGVLNPVFSGISFAFYDTPMSIINSPQGFKTLAPKAIVASIRSIKSSDEFQRMLAANGARPYGGSGASAFIKPDAKSLAAQRNILANFKHTVSNPEVAISKLDVWGGKLANMTRTRVARAAYDDALRKAKAAGEDVASEAVQKRAIENATLAYRTIMPDFDTMSNLTRQINSVVPFYSASVAGTRSLGKALKRDPVGTSAKFLTLGIAPTVGVTAFNLMQPSGQEFYKDMEASGQTATLDNNMIVVLPGAHKDDKTGQWSGIVKIPLAPEFRALNQTTWRTVRGATGGEGPGASQVALSMFDTVTGGVRTSENPLVSTMKILAGEDPRTGERIIKGDMADLPKDQQVYDTTSDAGKFVGGVFGTSPIQGDKILGQFGLVGQTAKNGGKPASAVAENIANRFTGAYGERAGDAFFNTYNPIKAKRDKVSSEVTMLVKAGKPGEARRKANEFNETLPGSFSSFNEKYGNSDAYDPMYDELLNSLAIKTSKSSFKARWDQK